MHSGGSPCKRRNCVRICALQHTRDLRIIRVGRKTAIPTYCCNANMRCLAFDVSRPEGVLMLLPMPMCLFNRHKPNRAKAKWDGADFVANCRHCGTRIRRKEHKLWIAAREEP